MRDTIFDSTRATEEGAAASDSPGLSDVSLMSSDGASIASMDYHSVAMGDERYVILSKETVQEIFNATLNEMTASGQLTGPLSKTPDSSDGHASGELDVESQKINPRILKTHPLTCSVLQIKRDDVPLVVKSPKENVGSNRELHKSGNKDLLASQEKVLCNGASSPKGTSETETDEIDRNKTHPCRHGTSLLQNEALDLTLRSPARSPLQPRSSHCVTGTTESKNTSIPSGEGHSITTNLGGNRSPSPTEYEKPVIKRVNSSVSNSPQNTAPNDLIDTSASCGVCMDNSNKTSSAHTDRISCVHNTQEQIVKTGESQKNMTKNTKEKTVERRRVESNWVLLNKSTICDVVDSLCSGMESETESDDPSAEETDNENRTARGMDIRNRLSGNFKSDGRDGSGEKRGDSLTMGQLTKPYVSVITNKDNEKNKLSLNTASKGINPLATRNPSHASKPLQEVPKVSNVRVDDRSKYKKNLCNRLVTKAGSIPSSLHSPPIKECWVALNKNVVFELFDSAIRNCENETEDIDPVSPQHQDTDRINSFSTNSSERDDDNEVENHCSTQENIDKSLTLNPEVLTAQLFSPDKHNAIITPLDQHDSTRRRESNSTNKIASQNQISETKDNFKSNSRLVKRKKKNSDVEDNLSRKYRKTDMINKRPITSQENVTHNQSQLHSSTMKRLLQCKIRSQDPESELIPSERQGSNDVMTSKTNSQSEAIIDIESNHAHGISDRSSPLTSQRRNQSQSPNSNFSRRGVQLEPKNKSAEEQRNMDVSFSLHSVTPVIKSLLSTEQRKYDQSQQGKNSEKIDSRHEELNLKQLASCPEKTRSIPGSVSVLTPTGDIIRQPESHSSPKLGWVAVSKVDVHTIVDSVVSTMMQDDSVDQGESESIGSNASPGSLPSNDSVALSPESGQFPADSLGTGRVNTFPGLQREDSFSGQTPDPKNTTQNSGVEDNFSDTSLKITKNNKTVFSKTVSEALTSSELTEEAAKKPGFKWKSNLLMRVNEESKNESCPSTKNEKVVEGRRFNCKTKVTPRGKCKRRIGGASRKSNSGAVITSK